MAQLKGVCRFALGKAFYFVQYSMYDTYAMDGIVHLMLARTCVLASLFKVAKNVNAVQW